MEPKVLYSKRNADTELERNKTTEEQPPEEAKRKLIQFFANYTQNITYIPIPEKEPVKTAFIDEVIAFVEEERTDAEIVEKAGLVEAIVYFKKVGMIGDLKRAIGLADDIIINTDHEKEEITVSLIFYTHYRITKFGELINP